MIVIYTDDNIVYGEKLAAAAQMVERMEIIAKAGHQIILVYRNLAYQCWIDSRFNRGNVIGAVEAFNHALAEHLKSLPDPQRSELSKKLGV